MLSSLQAPMWQLFLLFLKQMKQKDKATKLLEISSKSVSRIYTESSCQWVGNLSKFSDWILS